MDKLFGKDVSKLKAALSPTVWEGDCLVWKGYTVQGYGRFNVDYTPILAHRAAWFVHTGVIPSGKMVCHTCDNPPCINPDHLFLGDHILNNRDKAIKGRAPSIHGDNCGKSKISEKQALEIRERLSKGESCRELTKYYPIGVDAIDDIRTRHTWKHI